MCHKFYDHLRARGYPARAMDATFRKVTLNQRSKLLEPKVTSKAEAFFDGDMDWVAEKGLPQVVTCKYVPSPARPE